MAVLYLMAGFNHFINPEFYIKIIPRYLGNAQLINIISAIAEISLAILLFFKFFRIWACYAIILMLLAFIPAHIFMLQKDFCIGENCTPQWILWIRLLVLQPLLIWWAWAVRNVE